jgi:hypothetical protein
MPPTPRLSPVNRFYAPILLAGLLAALGGCAAFRTASDADTPVAPIPATARGADIGSYLEVFDRLAPGDVARQANELDALNTAALATPTASNRLRYALALGAAGHPGSNPVEARRLITELLAGAHDLRPQEVSMANSYLREFDARVALYADLAREREENESKLRAMDADGDRKLNAANAENQKLRKALADAERKLEAVAEMERALTEQAPNQGQ